MALEMDKIIPQTDLYTPQMATLVETIEQTPQETLLRFELEGGRPLGHAPGQFVQVCCFGIGEAPISVASMPTQEAVFDLCVRRIGNVTGALHCLKPGAVVGIRGPYGRGFPVEALGGRDLLLVAGGIGLVPLRSLIQTVLADRGSYGRVTILCGFKAPAERLFVDELEQWGAREDVDLRLTVDRHAEGWNGHVGVITTLFPELEITPERTKAVIVGPPIMYRFVIEECKLKGIADEDLILSLERRMKCGVGKCGHCQINHRYCCQDGPVFPYSELKFMLEAI